MKIFGVAAVLCLSAVGLAGPASAEPPGTAIDTYPIADGNFSSPNPGDYGRLFFQRPDGRHCAIFPNGGPVGCDAVPLDAPAGTSQVTASPWSAGSYVHSDIATYTRDFAPVLPEGRRLVLMGASCGVGFQGTVTCKTSPDNGFTIAATYGILW